MILKNKLTRETLEITYSEFRKKFVKEIRTAFESYCRTQLNKYSYNFKDDNSMDTISTSNYNGTSITLEIPIGILKIYNKKYILFL